MTRGAASLPNLPWMQDSQETDRHLAVAGRPEDRGFGWGRSGMPRHGSGTEAAERHGSGMPGGTETDSDADGRLGERHGQEGDMRHSGTATQQRHAAPHAGRAAAVPVGPERHGDLEPTHHIHVPERAAQAPAVPEDDGRAAAARAGTVREWVLGFDWVGGSLGSLSDHLHFAKEAHYNGSDIAAVRAAHKLFFWCWTVPVSSVMFFFLYAVVIRAHRCLTAVGIVVAVAPFANGLPVFAGLVPEWLDVTTWMPWWAVPVAVVAAAAVVFRSTLARLRDSR